MTAGLGGEDTTQIGFSAAGGTGDQHIAVLVYPVAAEQIGKLALVQAPGMPVIDVLRTGLQLEPAAFNRRVILWLLRYVVSRSTSNAIRSSKPNSSWVAGWASCCARASAIPVSLSVRKMGSV